MVENIREFSLLELEARFKTQGIQPYRARQVFGWLYDKGVEEFSGMTNLPRDLQEKLASFYRIEKPEIVRIVTARDMTQKFVFKLADGALIESVSIPAKSRLTVCLSTQVGCKFGCLFCASGANGFRRNLTTAEILSQFIAIRRHVPEGHVSNIVFMGVGEPLDNYAALMKAIRILNDALGVRLGARKITISTAGLVPGIDKLGQEGMQLELSVSLHAATDEKRSQLMPINRRYPLKQVMGAVRRYILATKRKVTFEYVLLGGFNTTVEDAEALCRLARGTLTRVNLIPYNPGIGRAAFEAPTKLEVLFFKSYLTKKGLDVTLRMPRGEDIAAACGQLRAAAMEETKAHGA